MARIRLVFGLLAVALLLPTGLLARRALDGVAAERAARHRTVAERVFDEMERSLSHFLETEEERPHRDYLDAISTEPFVMGYFQVETDGRIISPDDPALAPLVRGQLAERANEKQEERVLPDQAPGTTLALDDERLSQLRERGYLPQERAEPGALRAAPERGRTSSAYDALQSLNRGVAQRSARSPKVMEGLAEPPQPDAKARAARREIVAAGAAYASADAAPTLADDLGADRDAFPAPGAPEYRKAEPRAPEAPPASARVGERAGLARADTLRVTVDPLLGRVADERHLLLYRTVLIGEQGIRQGLVVELSGLARWLREGVLAPLSLPASVRFFPDGEAEPALEDGSGALYRHRFAEPFQGLTAALSLAPLAGGGGESTIYALSLLVLLAAAAGLFALYRMVAVTVAFAERRSNFVAAVSHELRTPLTAIRMYGEMLRDGMVPGDAKRQEYYATITAESERLSRLINNVLEFSRLEKGTREVSLVAGDLGAVVTEMAEVVRPHAEREGFVLELEIAPDLPPVRFDRDALLQVLFNLVDNAVKYAGEARDRSIQLACRRAGDGVELVVRDHGPGVATGQLARVFEPFYRAEDELTRTTQGTGLGLALVKGLAERMGAAISGRNAQGGGLEVCMRFPAGAVAG